MKKKNYDTSPQLKDTQPMNQEPYQEPVSLLNYFDRTQIDAIQQRLAKVTQMGFVTVNDRGESITERTSFSSFCDCIRNDSILSEGCRLSDAGGALLAAASGQPYIYLCHCGLVEIAIPISVDDKNIGYFLCGQVHCPNAPADVPRIGNEANQKRLAEMTEKLNESWNALPTYSYERIQDFARMTELVISLLTENKKIQLQREKELQKQIDLLEYIAKQKIALDTDPLTGVYSRYAFSNALKEYDDCTQLPEGFAAITIDVNSLKQINDSLGHDAGDELIRGATDCITRVSGKDGRCFRTGGDEFVVLATEMNHTKAEAMLEALEAETNRWDGKTVHQLSLAAGYALAEDHPGITAEKLVFKADQAMYEKKAEYYQKSENDRRKPTHIQPDCV